MEKQEIKTVLRVGNEDAIGRIVVPITLDHDHDRGVSLAAALATRWALPVHLVSVSMGAEDQVDIASGEVLEDVRRSLRAAHPEVDATDELVAAATDPVEHLAACLAPSDLVVMATSGADDASSFAQALTQAWGGPVMMIGPHAGIDIAEGGVLVGVDGSALAERALPAALDLAAAMDREVWVVHVVPAAVTQHVADLRARGERVSENAYVRDVVERLDAGQSAAWEVVHAEDAASALVEFAADRHASWIVLATHGQSGVLRPAFGSVCMAVVRHATRPVVVVRPVPPTPEVELTEG